MPRRMRKPQRTGLPTVPKWLKAAFEQMPLPVSVTVNRKLVWVNPAFCTFYGCTDGGTRGTLSA